MRSTHRRISCSMVVGRASTPTSSNPVSSWCKDSPRVARASLTFECHYHQKSAPPYKHQEHKTTHDLETILQATHPPPPAWGFSIKLLSISFLCCLNLGLGCKFHMSYMLFDCICTGCLLLQPSMTWCKVEKGQTSPSRSSTFSASPSVAAVLGWEEACVFRDTLIVW